MNKRKKDTKEWKIELRGELKKGGESINKPNIELVVTFFCALSQWILRVTGKKRKTETLGFANITQNITLSLLLKLIHQAN